MAKEEIKKSSSELDKFFGQMVKDHESIAPGSATTGDKMFAEVKTWIGTGATILDTVISNDASIGGWPAGRTVELYGEEAIGKSTLVFTGFAKVQKAGGVAIYFDIEQAGARNMMEACGIDMHRLIYSGNSGLEEIFQAIEKNLNTVISSGLFKGKPVLIALDSLAQMMPEAEIEAGYDFNMNISLKKAIQLGKALRKITPLLNKANACLIIINQLRDAPGGYGDTTTTPGGKALRFAATLRIKLMGKTPVKIMDPCAEREYKLLVDQWERDCIDWKNNGGSKGTGQPKPAKPKKPKGDEVIIGYDVIARTDKNKVGPPKREAEFRIIFGQGIIEEYAWFDYALKFSLLEPDGSFDYTIPQFPKVEKFRRVSWINILNSDSKLKEFMRKGIVSKLVRTAADYVEVDEAEAEEVAFTEVVEKEIKAELPVNDNFETEKPEEVKETEIK
jgi:recombination protein RecA